MRHWALALVLFCLVVLSAPVRGEEDVEYRKPDAPKNSFSLSYEHENFQGTSTQSWELASAEISHKFEGFGSVILRVNRAERFGRDGLQYEIDAYPKLAKGVYMYLNAGVSDDSLFPKRRFGAQIYKSLGKGWEGSIGVRHLEFNDTTTIYTGSIGRYKGNWYTTLTPYVVPKERGASASAALEVRRYKSSGDDYWMFRGSYGNAPEVDTLLEITNRLDSGSISIGRQMPLVKRRTFLKMKASYSEKEFSSRVKRESVSIAIGLKHRF